MPLNAGLKSTLACETFHSIMGVVRLQIQPLTPLVDEFAGRLFGELDYIQEGLNAERFQVSAMSLWNQLSDQHCSCQCARHILLEPAISCHGLKVSGHFVGLAQECPLRHALWAHAAPSALCVERTNVEEQTGKEDCVGHLPWILLRARHRLSQP